MSARKSGGTGARTKAKNQAMAAAMKAAHVERHTCRCPICHTLVGLQSLYGHVGKCNGR